MTQKKISKKSIFRYFKIAIKDDRSDLFPSSNLFASTEKNDLANSDILSTFLVYEGFSFFNLGKNPLC